MTDRLQQTGDRQRQPARTFPLRAQVVDTSFWTQVSRSITTSNPIVPEVTHPQVSRYKFPEATQLLNLQFH